MDVYRLGKKLGDGVHAGVFEATLKEAEEDEQKEFAVKIMAMDKLDALNRELTALRRVGMHPNVICFYRHFTTLSRRQPQPKLYLVLERARISLLDLVAMGQWAEISVGAVVRTLAELLLYFHSRGVVHRDLKPANVLFMTAEVEPLCDGGKVGVGVNWEAMALRSQLRVCDFGLAKVMSSAFLDGSALTRLPSSAAETAVPTDISLRRIRMKSIVASKFYAAPELLRGEEYDQAVDMWGLGVCMYMMLVGRMPFRGKQWMDNAAVGNVDMSDACWLSITKEARSLTASLLQADGDKRAKLADVFNSDWCKRPNRLPRRPIPRMKAVPALEVLRRSRLPRFQDVEPAAAAPAAVASEAAAGAGAGAAGGAAAAGKGASPVVRVVASPLLARGKRGQAVPAPGGGSGSPLLSRGRRGRPTMIAPAAAAKSGGGGSGLDGSPLLQRGDRRHMRKTMVAPAAAVASRVEDGAEEEKKAVFVSPLARNALDGGAAKADSAVDRPPASGSLPVAIGGGGLSGSVLLDTSSRRRRGRPRGERRAELRSAV
eukprot:PLAT15476.1.p1 GENE.PLAT15476.1~~PLAT15476.1.p1  ORF type:complete len:566 (+),score=158.46 PLAT15476.1:67-1698(+)